MSRTFTRPSPVTSAHVVFGRRTTGSPPWCENLSGLPRTIDAKPAMRWDSWFVPPGLMTIASPMENPVVAATGSSVAPAGTDPVRVVETVPPTVGVAVGVLVAPAAVVRVAVAVLVDVGTDVFVAVGGCATLVFVGVDVAATVVLVAVGLLVLVAVAVDVRVAVAVGVGVFTPGWLVGEAVAVDVAVGVFVAVEVGVLVPG